MIYVALEGRCGNQFFAYAFARKLQSVYREKLTFIYQSPGNGDPTFCNILGEFRTAPYRTEVYRGNVVSRYGSVSQKLWMCVYKLICALPYKRRVQFYERQTGWQPFLNRHGIYWLIRGYSVPGVSKCKNKFINGTFEDKRYFDDIREQLLEELQPVQPPKEKNRKLYNLINSRNSVCVSVRRGDFMDPANRGLRDICTYEYYREAIERIREKVENPVFIIFSDEIEWVREHYHFEGDIYYEEGGDEIWEKMRLMYSCKHFIMSNSTFCWWAQYLGRAPDKVVMSPSRWFNMEGYTHSLIDEKWELIDI